MQGPGPAPATAARHHLSDQRKACDLTWWSLPFLTPMKHACFDFMEITGTTSASWLVRKYSPYHREVAWSEEEQYVGGGQT